MQPSEQQVERIQRRFPTQHPERIQLYSMATANGLKVSILLEEVGLLYDPHLVHIGKDDQFSEEFILLSPNSKIPAIMDPSGPGGRPLALSESAAILIYLAEKTGKLAPTGEAERLECLQWLFFQMGHVGPMFGQYGHFKKFAGDACKDPYPLARYTKEVRRLLGVIEARLGGRDFILGGYSIADIAIFPWVNTVVGFYEGTEDVGFASFPRVAAWLGRCNERPATERGKLACRP